MRRREFITTLGGAAATVAWPLAIGTSTSVLAVDPNWPKSLTLGTASPGGVYYVYGGALAEILTKKLGIPVDPLPTQGPVHNVRLIESGGAQLGLITMGVGFQGWTGTGDWTSGKHFQAMRALFPMYDTAFQFVVLKRSGISKVQMLDKLDVGVGPRAGTGGTYVPEVLKALGLYALVLGLGAPIPAVKKLEATEPLNFISLSGPEVNVVRKAIPELTPSTIAAGVYSSLDKDYTTVGVYNFAVGRSDLPDDLVYNLVKAVHDNQPRLMSSTDSAKETLPQNVVKDTFLPLHPGAARYYREVGISISHSLVPTN
jgi:TRAP-type uncharacterized transport system substrate-binding protein